MKNELHLPAGKKTVERFNKAALRDTAKRAVAELEEKGLIRKTLRPLLRDFPSRKEYHFPD